MKRIFYFFFFFPLLVTAQPSGYYNGALGLNGQALENALHTIISGGYVQLTYTPGLWNAYHSTDVKPNGKLWDIYSDKPGGTPAYEFTIGTQQCGSNNPSSEGNCYNREHIWPQSKFGSNYPMYTDLWIVYPTDYYVNNQRGDDAYGKVNTATKTFTNGSKIGINTYTGAPATACFEPIDSFKGDIARSYFYIMTRYLADSAQFTDWDMATKARLKPWAINMMLEWHHLDPVSSKEMKRNDSVYAQQHNRNPFIDYPQFADCIWGNGDCSSLSIPGFANVLNKINVYPNPAHGKVIIDWQKLSPDEVLAVDILNMQGQVLFNQPVQSSALKNAEVETSDWAKGIYLLEIRTRHGMQVQKMVVE